VRAERERERDEEGRGEGGGGQQYGQLEARVGLPAFRYMLWPPVTGRARRRRNIRATSTRTELRFTPRPHTSGA
jgi:hypothetical protein